jgi:hypothetical protein
VGVVVKRAYAIGALVLAALSLTVAATASVTAYAPWKSRGATYSCKGYGPAVWCKETNWKPAYEVSIIPGSIIVSFQGRVIFDCERGIRPARNCQSFVEGPS